MPTSLRPRRSVLFMPGANSRAMEKARTLAADTLILDLEDAVAPAAKSNAREQVIAAVNAGGFGHREVTVRINPLDSPWGQADLAAISKLPIDGLVIPKVESAEMIQAVFQGLCDSPNSIPIWAMLETPKAILRSAEITANSPGLTCILMGTSDLSKDLRLPTDAPVAGLMWSLSHCVVAARAAGLDIIDGVHLNLGDEPGLKAACQRAKALGFDGKSLIHPKQLALANEIFGVSTADVEHAQRIIEAHADAERAGNGVAVLDGKLVENLHVEQARRTLALAAAE